jgi:hypothetical protein
MKKMTEDDKEFLKEFLRGFGGGTIVFIVFCLLCSLTIWLSGSKTVEDSEQSTKVVGEYKGCDIIQWNYGSLAEYKYFLYCNKDDRSN